MGAALKPSEVKPWMQQHSRGFVTSDELAGLLDCDRSQVPHRLRRQRDNYDIVAVTKGGWTWANKAERLMPSSDGWLRTEGPAVPYNNYLDDMMRHLGHEYYLGGRSAADHVYRATQQGIRLVTIYSTKRLRNRVIAGTHFHFKHRPDIERYPTIRHEAGNRGMSGSSLITVSTRLVTYLDCIREGVSDIVANIAGRFIDTMRDDADGNPIHQIDPHELADIAKLYPIATQQRAGYVMQFMSEWTGVPFDLAPLRSAIPPRVQDVCLYRGRDKYSADMRLEPQWHVLVDYDLDPDI